MRALRRLTLLGLAPLALSSCTGAADAENAAGVVFSESTPRQAILDQFQEILNWTGVAIDNTVVLGQNRCVLTVAVSDTANAAAIREAFMPIAQAASTTLCPPMVVLRLQPYTRAQVEETRLRVDSLLADENAGASTTLTPLGELVVEVKNIPAVERAQKALAADAGLPVGIVVRPRLWMREAENPRQPPLEAFTAILVDHYRRAASPATTVGVLRSSLPRGYAERNLQRLPVRIVDDPSEVTYLIRFGGATQLEDGIFMIDAVGNRAGAQAAPKPVGVDCVGQECFLVDVLPPATQGGDAATAP
jgi:hypothetical protein